MVGSRRRYRHGILPALHSHTGLLLGAIMLFLALAPARAQAQALDQLSEEELIERTAEPAGEEPGEDLDLLDDLGIYRRRPLNLHTTTADSLARIPGISIRDAAAILAFVDTASPARIDELEAIATLSADQLQLLRIYTSLAPPGPSASSEPFTMSVRTRFQQDLQPRRGYTDRLLRTIPRRDALTGDSLGIDTISIGAPYLGGRAGLLTRILAGYGAYSAGITFEKDPGETLFTYDTAMLSYSRYEYVDAQAASSGIKRRFGGFLSAHATAHVGPVSIHLGDYTAEFGQGLLLWSSYGGGKGGEMIGAPYKSARGITPYRSAAETGFLRGAALGLHLHEGMLSGLEAHLFWSERMLDASFEESIDTAGAVAEQASSIREDGYRRTRSELRRSANLGETLLGGALSMRFRGGNIGLVGYASRFAMPLSDPLTVSYGGERTTMMSIHGQYARWGMFLFGELARAPNGTPGAIGGITSTIGSTDIMVAGRSLPASFATPHGTGFGESPRRQRNEQGIYIAAKTAIIGGLFLSAYLDHYRFPERSSLVPFPRTCADGTLRLDYALGSSLRLYGQLRSQTKGFAPTIADSLGRERKRVVDRSSTSGRFSAEYQTRGGRFRLRARIERRFVGYTDGIPSVSGVLTFVDLRLRPRTSLALGARLAIFDTDDFDAAIYEFEQDLPGRITNLALSGEGRRLYLYARWTHGPTVSVAAKYGETVYADREAISHGGLQEIAGPIGSTLAVQVDVRF